MSFYLQIAELYPFIYIPDKSEALPIRYKYSCDDINGGNQSFTSGKQKNELTLKNIVNSIYMNFICVSAFFLFYIEFDDLMSGIIDITIVLIH